MKTIVSFLLIFLGFLLPAHAQVLSNQVIGSGGGHLSNNTVSLDWTLGEPVIQTFENNETILTQGFHQVYYKITEIKELKSEAIQTKVYPNPASDWVNIKITGTKDSKTVIQLYDLNGTCVYSKKLAPCEYIEEKLDLSDLPEQVYILKIFSGKEHACSYKIRKIK